MKTRSRQLLLIAVLALTLVFAMAVTASAAEEKGMTDVKADSLSVTLVPQTAGGTEVIADSSFYAGAERLKLTYDGCTSGKYYAVFVLDGDGVPTQNNIAYINQVTAEKSSVEFVLFPKQIVNGTTYNIYISSNDGSVYKHVGSFKGAVKGGETPDYILGDVDLDGDVDAADLTALAKHVSKISKLTDEKALLAANVDKTGTSADDIDASDLTKLAKYVAKIITTL